MEIQFGADTSHHVSTTDHPLDHKTLYSRLKAIKPDEEPFYITKICQGTTVYPEWYDLCQKAKDAGFLYIGGFGFFTTTDNPDAQFDTYYKQFQRFPFNIQPSLDCENWSGMPKPGAGYADKVWCWFEKLKATTGVPGILYTNQSYIISYFQDPKFSQLFLWLSQPPSNTNYQYLIGMPTPVLPWLFVSIHQLSYNNFMGRWFGVAPGVNNHIDLDRAFFLPTMTTPNPPPTPPPDPDPEPEVRKAVVIVDAVNVRTAPNTSASIIGHVSNGETIIVIASSSSPTAPTEWVQHESTGVLGWSCHHTTQNRYMMDVE